MNYLMKRFDTLRKTIKFLITNHPLLELLIKRYKYGKGIHYSVDVNVSEGFFSIGTGSSIGKFSILVIPKKTKLIIGSSSYIGRYVEIGPAPSEIVIKNNITIQDRCMLLGKIQINSNTIIGPNVFISSGQHHFNQIPPMPIRMQDNLVLSSKLKYDHKKVTLEEDCWIGTYSVIMPGVTIGKGSIIGAGSIVTKNIPPYSIAVGNPCQVIKKRLDFSPSTAIYSNKLDHWPYYYRGFHFESQNDNEFDCYVDESDICLVLNTNGARKIYLEIILSEIGSLSIFFEKQCSILKHGINHVEFDLIETNNKSQLNFHIDNWSDTWKNKIQISKGMVK